MAVTTYHCLCTELVLATTRLLNDLPARQGDGAFICKLADASALPQGASVLTSAVSVEPTPAILKLEDGFEKRYAAKCSRCGLMLGYQLDLSQFEETKASGGSRDDVVYVLRGGLMTTDEMAEGKKMDTEIELPAVKAG